MTPADDGSELLVRVVTEQKRSVSTWLFFVSIKAHFLLRLGGVTYIYSSNLSEKETPEGFFISLLASKSTPSYELLCNDLLCNNISVDFSAIVDDELSKNSVGVSLEYSLVTKSFKFFDFPCGFHNSF